MTDEHRHCKVCGRVCAPGQETCSPKCATAWERRARDRRAYIYLFFGMAALLFLLLVSSYVAHV